MASQSALDGPEQVDTHILEHSMHSLSSFRRIPGGHEARQVFWYFTFGIGHVRH